jgi:peroxiredoxin/YHS domain-containing protein
MKIAHVVFICVANLLILPRPARPQMPKEAICAVCRITEGATKPEKVVATSEYQKATHYFCSPKCKEEFDADPAAYLPPVLPRPAPGFAIKNLTGETVALENYRGKVVLLDFWATWCKPCVKSMPALQKLHDRFATKNFSVLGISIDENAKKVVAPFLKKHKITYPILFDAEENSAWEAYKVKVIPMMFLVDSQSQIVQQWVGETDMKEVERVVVSLLEKKD